MVPRCLPNTIRAAAVLVYVSTSTSWKLLESRSQTRLLFPIPAWARLAEPSHVLVQEGALQMKCPVARWLNGAIVSSSVKWSVCLEIDGLPESFQF